MSVSSNVAPAEAGALHGRNVNRLAVLLVVLAVMAGAVCRAAQYAADRSFWVDEAALLLNVRSHSFGQLFGHLDYEQAAPPLFMATERGLMLMLGPSEFSLRLLPLVCGIAGLVVFALVARRVLESPWDAVAVALFAFSDRFIWHGTEVKQYGVDLFVATVLTWLAIGSREGMSATWRLVVTGCVAAAAVWFSYPVMFVFAAASLAMMPRGKEKGCAVGPWLIVNGVAASSFLILIRTVIRAQQTGGLTAYWAVEFLDWHRPWAWPWWVVRRLHSMCNYEVPGAGPVLLIAMAAGIVRMWRERKFERLVILAGPMGFVIIAAAAHRYPFDGARLTTFLCGSMLILASLGMWWGFDAARSVGSKGGGAVWKWVGLVPAGYVLIVASVSAAWHLVLPRNRGHLRPVLEHVREAARPGDRIYVLNDRRAFMWYWPEAEGDVKAGSEAPPGTSGGRFWVVWSFSNQTGKRLADPVLKYGRSIGNEQDEVFSDGGGAVLIAPQGLASESAPNIDGVFVVPGRP
jgi:hypothetical protein